jgi:hypothetical protein
VTGAHDSVEIADTGVGMSTEELARRSIPSSAAATSAAKGRASACRSCALSERYGWPVSWKVRLARHDCDHKLPFSHPCLGWEPPRTAAVRALLPRPMPLPFPRGVPHVHARARGPSVPTPLADAAARRRRTRRRGLVVLSHRGEAAATAYRTEPVERGEIRTAISATGTLSATATVDVGTQVSGTLQRGGGLQRHVKAGQVIARLDPSTLQARLDQASAALASSQASLGEAQATAKNAEADYARKSELAAEAADRAHRRRPALAARDQARARIASAQAQIRQQQASVNSARWTWRRA